MSFVSFLPRLTHKTHKATLHSILSTYESLVHTPPSPPAQSISYLRDFANQHPTYILRSVYWIRQHSPITLFHEYILLEVFDEGEGANGDSEWIRIDRRAGGDFRLSLLWLPSEETKNEVKVVSCLFDGFNKFTSRIMGKYEFSSSSSSSDAVEGGGGGEGVRIGTVASVLEKMEKLQTQYRIWSSNCWTWSRAIFLIFTSGGGGGGGGGGGMERALDQELEKYRRSTKKLITTDILRAMGAGVMIATWAGIAGPFGMKEASIGLMVGMGVVGGVVGEVVHRLTIGRRVGEWNVFVGQMEEYFHEMRKVEWKVVGSGGEVVVECEVQ